MYELIQLTDKCYYIECPSKIGLIRLNENEVCLIDSGNDKETGRKIRKILDTHGWTLKSIYNTHSHADHIGGNKYLQTQTGCNIYAPAIHATFTKYPHLEGSFLYGALPPKDLQNKFLLAAESEAEILSAHNLPQGLNALKLPGHFLDMVGYAYDEGVIYLADSLLSQEILDKYQIAVLYDVQSYLDSLEKIKTLQAKFFVPSHSEVTNNIAPLAQYNIDKVHAVAEKILLLCRLPLMFEELLQRLFTDYGLKMTFGQYVLVGTSVRALLCWLKEQEKMEVIIEDNKMLWKSL